MSTGKIKQNKRKIINCCMSHRKTSIKDTNVVAIIAKPCTTSKMDGLH